MGRMSLNCFGDVADTCCLYKSKRRNNRHSQKSRYDFLVDDAGGTFHEGVRVFSFNDLEKATNGFKRCIGKGGFGQIFHGTLEDGTEIAVKKFTESRSRVSHVIKIMAGIRHRNVIRLIGCCEDGDKPMLVFEFMERGDLSSFLFDYGGRLSWATRAAICVSIARGLVYLHEGISPRIVHRDIKLQNILIDRDLKPKITGFTVAEFIGDDASHHSDVVIGTMGYIDPDYMVTGHLTEKSDVYSFGVVLLEVISGRKSIEREVDDYSLVILVWQLWESGRLLDIVDPNLLPLEDDEEHEVLKFINTALLCVQQTSGRPRMSEVVLMLSGVYDFSQKEWRKPCFRTNSQLSHYSDNLLDGSSIKQDLEALGTEESLPGKGDSTCASPDKEGLLSMNEIAEDEPGKGHDFLQAGGTSFKAATPMTVVSEGDVGSVGEIELKILDPKPEPPKSVGLGPKPEHPMPEPPMLEPPKPEPPMPEPPKPEPPKQEPTEEPPKPEPPEEPPAFGEWYTNSGEWYTNSRVDLAKDFAKPRITKNSADMVGVSSVRPVGEIESDVASFSTDVRSNHSINEEWTHSVLDSAAESKLPTQQDFAGPASAAVSGAGHQAVQIDLVPVVSWRKKPNETDDNISFLSRVHHSNKVLSASDVDPWWSLDCNVQGIVEVLKDAEVRKIGLYGKGGIGKTTVLKALGSHPEIRNLFDLVIRVAMPRHSYGTKIQDQILQQLSLSVDSNSEDEKVDMILNHLMGKKFLLLLDDLWVPIDLHEIGLPKFGEGSSWKVVLASRGESLCVGMADKVLELKALSREEARSLFRVEAGEIVDHPEIEPYARTFVEECAGSPLLITVIGRSLKMETKPQEWKLALRQFLSPEDDRAGVSANLRLKFVFDRLNTLDLKSCFLCCALFPEYRAVNVSDLVNYFIDGGLQTGTKATAFEMGLDILWRLTDASLLEVTEDKSKVKMHNVLRDLALEIMSSEPEVCPWLLRSEVRLSQPRKMDKETVEKSTRALEAVENLSTPLISSSVAQNFITLSSSELREAPLVEEWEEARMIFLSGNDLSRLPARPACHRLSALFLQRNYNLRVIPSSFFDLMPALRILDLSKTRIKSLPQSLAKLEGLQVLLLRDCERLLVLPLEIGSLKCLEVLDLRGTEITHLPDTVSGMGSLRHLQLSFYGSIIHSDYLMLPQNLIPEGFIRSLNLTELGVFVFPGDRRWLTTALSLTREVSCLKLDALSFSFPDIAHLKHFIEESPSWKNGTLGKFNFVVGRDVKRIVSQVSCDVELMYSQQDRSLRFVNGVDEPRVPDVIVEVLKRATSFYLDHCVGIYFLSEFGISHHQALKLCVLRDCPEIESLVDDGDIEEIILPVLETLSLNYLGNLKNIWSGRMPTGSLSRLRYLTVRACPQLSFLFTSPMVESLSWLTELIVEDCASLKHMVTEDESVAHGSRVDSSVSVLPNLEVLKLHHLPELSGIWKGPWPPVKYISFYACPALRNLQMVSVVEASIREIKSEAAWWDALEWDDPAFAGKLQTRVVEIGDGDL